MLQMKVRMSLYVIMHLTIKEYGEYSKTMY